MYSDKEQYEQTTPTNHFTLPDLQEEKKDSIKTINLIRQKKLLRIVRKLNKLSREQKYALDWLQNVKSNTIIQIICKI